MEGSYINKLANVALKLSEMANDNLDQLNGKCEEPEEVQDYYLGMLRRQAMLTGDLWKILKERPPENLTTPYIILRSLLDDFLHLIYLDCHSSEEEEIVKINASAHKDNFKSLENLTTSDNQEYLGKSLNYLNKEKSEELKNIFKGFEKNKKYFDNIDEFKFKKFIPLSVLASKIDASEHYNVARDRAFYLWKSYSAFVHYSTWCFDMEMTDDIINIQQIEEALMYVFNSIYICAKKMEELKGIRCIVDPFMKTEMKFSILNLPPN
jgi:hypothetical protein